MKTFAIQSFPEARILKVRGRLGSCLPSGTCPVRRCRVSPGLVVSIQSRTFRTTPIFATASCSDSMLNLKQQNVSQPTAESSPPLQQDTIFASEQIDDRDEDLTFTLPSGRTLGYARYGVRESTQPTTIYFHGYPASRLEACFAAPDLHSKGLRLIAIDRPGFGLSAPDPHRSIMDHARDALALADHLELGRFAVIGISGGGPYAFACTQVIPAARLIRTGIVAGMGPWVMVRDPDVWKELWWLNKLGFLGPVYFPWLYNLIYPWLVKWFTRNMDKYTYDQLLESKEYKKLSDSDKQFVLKLGKRGYESSLRCVKEAMRQEQWARWHLQDANLLANPWEFELEDAKSEVQMWYGEKDTSTPAIYGQKIAQRLENGQLHVIEGATHAGAVMDTARFVKELVGA